MKKLLILLITSFTFIGCGVKRSPNDIERDKILTKQNCNTGYCISIINYDSCEYLVSGFNRGQMITHKGNCKNKIHIYNLDTITFKK